MRGKASRRQSAILMDTAASGVACFCRILLKRQYCRRGWVQARTSVSRGSHTLVIISLSTIGLLKARYTRER